MRRTQSFVEQLCWVVIWQWFQRFSALRRLPFHLEVLQEDSALFLSVFLELLRYSWERAFSLRRVIWWIFGGGAFASRFLGFVRRVEIS